MRTFAIALLLTTSLFAAGCGGDSGGGGGGGPAGTYVMDTAAMKPEIEKMMGPMMEMAKKALEMMPEDQRAKAQKEMDAKSADMMKEFNFTVTLNGDGTFAVVGATEGKKDQARGTWKLDGTTLSITTTHERGKEQENPETIQGTLKNGVIRMRPEKDMPFDLVFKKQ